MALKRRDVVLAAVAVFIAWGYLTHYSPSLRFLPYAFVAGVLATVVLQAWLMLTTAWDKDLRNGGNVYYGPRHVAFLAPDKWKAEKAALTKRSTYMMEPLYPDSFVISDSLDVLLGLILRDFVKSWYGSISKSPTFVNEVDRAVRAALGEIRDRLLAVDMVEIAVSRMIPLITEHLRAAYEAERVVRGKKLSRDVTESEELDIAIAAKYKEGRLHPAASLAYSNTKLVQQQHLRSIVARLLPKVMPQNMTTSPAVNVLIKEIVACAVLSPVMQMLADPDTWNQLMEGYGRSLLQERKTVRKLRAELDKHAPPSPKTPKNVQFPKLAPGDNERKFERFVRAIRQTNTLAEARRFRSEISGQLRKDSMIEGQDPVHLRRLETARRILDQKINNLQAGGSVRGKVAAQEKPKHKRTTSRFENASLRDVLYDSAGLSCFMEYMDQVGLMRLVQFWIVVDGIRNPLEQDTDEPVELSGSLTAWTDSDRTDMAQINEGYLTQPELDILPQARQAVTTFLKAGRAATPEQYHNARRSLLHAQTAVYDRLQEPHFRRFKRSNLYYKWLAMDEAATVQKSAVSTTMVAQTLENPSAVASARMVRSQSSQKNTKLDIPDLRRAVASSSDLKTLGKGLDLDPPPRRSLDSSAPARAPLFDDDYDSDPLANSTASLDTDAGLSRQPSDNTRAVEALSVAMNDIMGDEPEGSLFSEISTLASPQDNDSMRGSMELPRAISPGPLAMHGKDRLKPSIASLGLVGEPRTRGVFIDDLFGDEEKFLEDETEDPHRAAEEEDIHEAAPGDLGLAEAIDALTADIERLVTQESIVDSLTSKAELTNNAAELRILRKSKSSLQREIHRKELQRQQYIVQESDNSLYGRATVFIQSIMVGTEPDGKEFAMYVIEVRKRAGDQMPAAAWVVSRSFLKSVTWSSPRRQMMLKLQKDFLQKRRLGLEKYLRDLLLIPAVCRSREFRSFLSQAAISASDPASSQPTSNDFVSRIYSSVADGMEEFLGNIPVLDQLSVAGQNLISAATTQLANSNGTPVAPLAAGAVLGVETTTDAEAEAELLAFENKELEPFVKPICDIFLETFELNRENNWLRGRAVVVVLHQLLGGTIERKVRDSFNTVMSEDNIAKYIDTLKDSMWPNGQMKQSVERTAQDRAKSRKEAGVLLSTLVPELAASVVGRSNAQMAAKKLEATVNNPPLEYASCFHAFG
ncbi:tRNA (guanine-N(7)-)-methyltransferase (tRNA(m7G46)-methyltransferase) [Didymosphaeria variabile]|uniref:tRNA (Guanine-N(7)-)-methyltransferase (tRNA(m7G46)-methyltransferase) n=1 Tax=Didymosphaeria variabile TaxID=1932322 RepID=A0A9W8XMB9_9PLEO|nr:tRNA (guanine-N(7)-)-methyltransferase (tRNA(m7G46)-methyltransferase) [Didymosphaeria variabile]KAJ4353418.1 tRNA (guanine-N(7)-)-methyltransferase (tRNA(m7G46)-methyltransferase) [Didymosphaeria variabile]